MANDQPDALAFEPPGSEAPQNWAQAEAACLKFPERFMQMARELNECRRQLQQAWQEREQQHGFVVRNLIGVADNCKAALAALPAANGEALENMTVASIHRTVLHLLEEMGIVRVDLLDRTYEDVSVDGEKIDDPFEVLETEQRGKASAIRVKEVVLDLWVEKRAGTIQVVRRGRVNC